MGVFAPFFDATYVTKLKLVRRDAAGASTYATFTLTGDDGTGAKSLEGVLQGCSSKSMTGDVSPPSVEEWTSAYSGTLDDDGGLRLGAVTCATERRCRSTCSCAASACPATTTRRCSPSRRTAATTTAGATRGTA